MELLISYFLKNELYLTLMESVFITNFVVVFYVTPHFLKVRSESFSWSFIRLANHFNLSYFRSEYLPPRDFSGPGGSHSFDDNDDGGDGGSTGRPPPYSPRVPGVFLMLYVKPVLSSECFWACNKGKWLGIFQGWCNFI